MCQCMFKLAVTEMVCVRNTFNLIPCTAVMTADKNRIPDPTTSTTIVFTLDLRWFFPYPGFVRLRYIYHAKLL